MERRTLAAKETRRRIVDATMAAHAELGIAETSFQDVAERADVAVGTGYRHFPRLEDLVAACGAHRTLPFLTRDHELWEGAIDALVAEALRPLRTARWPRAHVRSLLDARFWINLSERGLGRPEAEALLRRLGSCALGSPGEAQPGGRQPPVAPR